MTISENLPRAPNQSTLVLARVGEIDLLRFIAAMLVVLFHYTFRGNAANSYSLTAYPTIAPITKYGYLGVELFFLISGFVILMTASNGSLKKFLASRFARLYPAFWVCCAITFGVIFLFGNDRFTATMQQFLVNLTMLHEFVNVKSIDGVYWSLAVELKFYFLVVVVLLFRQIHRAQWFLGIWLVSSLVLQWMPIPRVSAFLIPDYAPYFIAGAICYLAYQRGWSLSKALMILIALALALRSAMLSVVNLEKIYNTSFSSFLIGAITCSFFLLIAMVASRKTACLARWNWLAVGALTYPLYLIHQNIGYILFNAAHQYMNAYITLFVILALMLSISYAVNSVIEKPFAKPLQLFIGRVLTKVGVTF